MKNWIETRKLYIEDHLSKPLIQPQRRINALNAIEKLFQDNASNLLKDKNIFIILSKDEFLKKYKKWKGKSLSSAERSVINGIYKFSN
jgi:hypothetical protein